MRTARAVAVALLLVGALVAVRVSEVDAAALRPPVYAHDLPDPELVRDGLDWYLYGTNVFPSGKTINVPVLHSSDADHWSYVTDAMPKLASWTSPGLTWAPGVTRIGDTWHLYYTAPTQQGRQCIGHATSDSPTGPFVDDSDQPFMCQLDRGGSIDASPFLAADGNRYLLWKSDDNAIGQPSVLWSMRLDDNGKPASSPAALLVAANDWQMGVVEGPTMYTDASGNLWLFYGGGFWDTPGYGVGLATCTTPLGPCIDRTPGGPWLGTDDGVVGPGGPSIATGPLGRPVLAFHGWIGAVGYPDGSRAPYIEPFDITPLGPNLRPDLPRTQHDPIGSLDAAQVGPGSVTVTGWTIDPDTADPIDVHVYVDGTGYAIGPAALSRPDVAAVLPDYGPGHGYSARISGLAPGAHTVCAYGIDVGPGQNNGLGCQSISVMTGAPIGSLDVVQNGPASVTVAGWAIDPDTTSAITVHVYVDGHGFVLGPASLSRPDVGAVFPGYGSGHGFNSQLTGIAPGAHTVCAYGINVGPGQNSAVGCRSVVVLSGSPFGSLDLARGGAGSVTVAGWAIDPDTTSAITVHVYVDGHGFVLGPASLARPDVGAVLPGYGPNHGFVAQLTGIAPGMHMVCAYGIDVGPGSNNAVGCAQAVVSGS